jgi:hypothetical protein
MTRTAKGFFISPIGSPGSNARQRSDHIAEYIIAPAAQDYGITVTRGDQDPTPGQVTTHIVRAILESDVVIADLTGQNANTYYELGLAHALRKAVIILVDNSSSLLFDTQNERVITIGDEGLIGAAQAAEAANALRNALEIVLRDDYEPENLVTAVARYQILQSLIPENPIASELAAIREGMGSLRSLIEALLPESTSGRETHDLGTGEPSYDMLSTSTQASHAIVQACEHLGITRISTDGAAGDVMSEKLRSAQSIRIISTSAIRLIERNMSYLIEALSNGCSVRLLVPRPRSDFIRDVEEVERVGGLDSDLLPRAASLDAEIANISIKLSEALSEASRIRPSPLPSQAGKVSLGYFTTQLRSTMIMCDETWGWLTITLPPLRAMETASLELTSLELVSDTDRSLLRACLIHFDRTWEIVERRGDVTDL